MSNDHTALHHPAAVKFRHSHLSNHLLQCQLRHLRIIFRMRILPCKFWIHILKIRQINIHQAIEHVKHLCFLIATAVIYDRDMQSPCLCSFQRFRHLWQKLSCRHQINIICLLFLQIQKNIHKVFDRNLLPTLSS